MNLPEGIEEFMLKKGFISEKELVSIRQFLRENRVNIIEAVTRIFNFVEYSELCEEISAEFRIKQFSCQDKSIIDFILGKVDRDLAGRIDIMDVMRLESFPFLLKNNTLFIVSTVPYWEQAVSFYEKKMTFKKVKYIWVDRDCFEFLVKKLYFKQIKEKTLHGIVPRAIEESAYTVFSSGQVWVFAILLITFAIALYFNPLKTLIGANFFIQGLYLIFIGYKLLLSFAGEEEKDGKKIEKEIKKLKDNELPIYTILVPVYKEKNVVEILLEGLSKIDYPRERVEILILLEEDDTETIKSVFESIEKHDLSKETFRPIVVPHYLPKTKPKACNYGLIFARGKYLVIYDAEDIPEPNQLKMAIATFNKLPQNYICLQARLNYFNKDYNFLTRMFTLEYSYWFDYMLPGLSKFKLPIPLGGTSNHFKTEKLLELGGWDPYNTTEDADLGIRAYMRGYKVGVINSTTYEEANAKVWNWIRQRSRWIKGYMQTWLVYARKPLVLIKKTGFSGFLSFNLLIGGTPLTFLINPILWFIFFLWLLTKTEIVKPIFPSVIFYMALTNLAIGNFMGIYLNMLSIFKRKNYNLIFYAILNPLYWILHSIAAYKALWQLFTKPFYWEKTEHGISKVKQQ